MFKPTDTKRTIFFLFFDIVISILTLLLAYNLRFNFHIEVQFFRTFLLVAYVLIFLKILLFNYFKIYKVAWRYFSLNEAKKLLYAHIISYGLFVVVYYMFPDNFNPFPRSVIIIDLFLSMIFIGMFRLLKRIILEGGSNRIAKRTLVIGANSMTQTILKENEDYQIVSILDTQEMIVGTYFANIKVQHLDSLEKNILDNKIESIIITKQFEPKLLNKLYQQFNQLNIYDIKLVSISNKQTELKPLSVEDLLARHPKDLDKTAIKKFIKDKIILVTGAGGSIGSEIVRQCKNFEAKKIIALDHSEYNLYKIEQEINSNILIPIMQNVVNIDDLENTFAKYNPDIVIHAAAYKHVPLVETNINEAIKNNIIGTKNCIDLSCKYSVKKFVLISTDKAVRPTNVMGTTKRICELYAQNKKCDTEIVAVRFGNVLGSSGSVIPKFQEQIKNGKNLTVTHPDITRYFMLIPEACELVLQAGSLADGGEIFILDMGEPIKIVDLAKKMIELSGKKDEIDIEFVGLRAGEKLYEELLLDDSDKTTKYESILIAQPTVYNIENLNKDIEELLFSDDKIAKLKQIVPEFNHTLN